MRKLKTFITLLLATLFGCMMFSACELSTGATQKAGTYKFQEVMFIENGEIVKKKVGTDGITEDYLVIQLNEDGTMKYSDFNGEAVVTGTWKSLDYNLILFSLNDITSGDAELNKTKIIATYNSPYLIISSDDSTVILKKEQATLTPNISAPGGTSETPSSDGPLTKDMVVGNYQLECCYDFAEKNPKKYNIGDYVAWMGETLTTNLYKIQFNADDTATISSNSQAISGTWRIYQEQIVFETNFMGMVFTYNNSRIFLISPLIQNPDNKADAITYYFSFKKDSATEETSTISVDNVVGTYKPYSYFEMENSFEIREYGENSESITFHGDGTLSFGGETSGKWTILDNNFIQIDWDDDYNFLGMKKTLAFYNNSTIMFGFSMDGLILKK